MSASLPPSEETGGPAGLEVPGAQEALVALVALHLNSVVQEAPEVPAETVETAVAAAEAQAGHP